MNKRDVVEKLAQLVKQILSTYEQSLAEHKHAENATRQHYGKASLGTLLFTSRYEGHSNILRNMRLQWQVTMVSCDYFAQFGQYDYVQG